MNPMAELWESMFEKFWEEWPKGEKRARADAHKAFKALKPNSERFDQLMAALMRQKAERAAMARIPGQFIPRWPYPATWLRGERWLDEPLIDTPPAGGSGKEAVSDEFARRAAAARSRDPGR